MSSIQNDPNLFCDLNLQRLKNLANSWVNEIGNEIHDVCIEDINLYKYYSCSAKNQSKKHPVKYCVVFGIKDEILPEIDPYQRFSELSETEIESIPLGAWLDPPLDRLLSQSEKEEARNLKEKCKAQIAEIKKGKIDNHNGLDYSNNLIKPKSIYSFLGIFQTVDSCGLLLNSGFCEAYNYRPGNDYENEWIFLTRKLAEGNPGIDRVYWHWVLYDATDKAKISRTLETDATQPPMQTNANNISAEDFIRNIRVSFSSDTSIFLQSKKEKFQEFACNDMGFKPTSKTWKILIEILHDSNHQYYVGIYDKTKDPVKNKNYNKKIANMREFSKKFVSFLNQTYKAQIPKNFIVFENEHRTGNDRPGTYTTKFKIAQDDVGIKKVSEDNILEIIKDLTGQITNTKSEQDKDRLCKQVKPYVEHALSKGWITQEEYTKMIMPDDGNPSHDDAMAYIADRYQSF